MVIDGLALPGVAGSLMVENHRLRLVALVHHPLSLEMGLNEAQARTLRLIEQGSLARVQRVIVTSAATAETLLADFHVTPDRLGRGRARYRPAGAAATGLVADRQPAVRRDHHSRARVI